MILQVPSGESEFDAGGNEPTQFELLRAYYRFLKLARTNADLFRSEDIESTHPAEALKYCAKLPIG